MKYISIVTVILVLASCGNENPKQASPDLVNNPATAENPAAQSEALPEITFDEIIFDFGTINEGESVTHSFKFKNTGKADLLISNASASCGCTVPQWPKEPIKPGQESSIKVTFNSAGKPGQADKSVTVSANTNPSTTMVLIKGTVVPKDGSSPTPSH